MLVVTDTLIFARYRIDDDGSVKPKMKAKMAIPKTNVGSLRAVWTVPGLMATVSAEPMVRFWNLQANVNYILPLAAMPDLAEVATGDQILAVAYSPERALLACGTREGRVVLWRYDGAERSSSEEDWIPVHVANFGLSIEDLRWGHNAVLSVRRFVVLR